MTRYWFTIIDGHDQDMSLELKPGLNLLGRSSSARPSDPPGSHRMTIEDGAVSRTHCKVQWDLGKPPVLTHLSETNETLINGESVLDFELQGGETLEVGSTVLQFFHHSDSWVAPSDGNSWSPK